jgi:RND superfamily putative drug exporter
MFAALGRFTVRRRWLVLVLTVVVLVASAGIGGGVFDRLKSGGFFDPDAESTRAEEVLDDEFGAGQPDLVLLVEVDGGDVDAAEAVAAGTTLTEQLAAEDLVTQAQSYWSLGSPPPLKSTDGSEAIVLVQIDDSDEVAADQAIVDLSEQYSGEGDGYTVRMGGRGEIFRQVGETIEGDLASSESIAVPITLLLLILVFGGIVAALLPVGVGLVAIMGTFLVLYLVTLATDVSVYSITLTTAMGLGLAIDYSLFVVSRFREELAKGRTVEAAVVRTVETAGRTVAFSGLTVAVSLVALLIFPLYFLRSFAYAGVGVVLVAALASVVTLPALLAVLGHRVDALTLWKRKPKPVGEGLWHRLAIGVMRRPVLIGGAGVLFLLILGAPFLNVAFGIPDQRVLPEDASARVATEALVDDFDSDEAAAFGIAAPDAGPSSELSTEIDDYAARLSTIDGVQRVDAATGFYVDGEQVLPPGPLTERFESDEGTWFSVVPDVEPISEEGEQMVADIRAEPAPFEVLVGGFSAAFVDSRDAIFSLVPWAGLLIGVSTFVLLFLMFGSIVVPLKAIVLNLLSLTATFGAMVWIFQEGHGSGILDFTPTGYLDITTPILMFCIAFGLSMDYEVFLLSRIKEEHDRTGDNTASVALGLERTGRIVTAAALLLAVTFLSFATGSITFIKLFGLGLALAVIMDATLVRALLVPAFMRLAGEANWWAPRWLKAVHERIGLKESMPDELDLRESGVHDGLEPGDPDVEDDQDDRDDNDRELVSS